MVPMPKWKGCFIRLYYTQPVFSKLGLKSFNANFSLCSIGGGGGGKKKKKKKKKKVKGEKRKKKKAFLKIKINKRSSADRVKKENETGIFNYIF